MNSHTFATSATVWMSVNESFGLPYVMFSAMDASRRLDYWLTVVARSRRLCTSVGCKMHHGAVRLELVQELKLAGATAGLPEREEASITTHSFSMNNSCRRSHCSA